MPSPPDWGDKEGDYATRTLYAEGTPSTCLAFAAHSVHLDPMTGSDLGPARPMGAKRGRGRGTLIDSVLEAIDGFYAEVVQYLKAWSAAPPRVRADSDATVEQPVAAALVSTALSSQDGAETAVDGMVEPDLPRGEGTGADKVSVGPEGETRTID